MRSRRTRRLPSAGTQRARSPKSLRSSDSFRRFVLDQLEPLDVTARSMFGGTGLYSAGVFFGIIARDTLYLKVDDANRPMFEREGMRPFKPFADRPMTMRYYAVPVAVLESALELVRWARTSIAATPERPKGGPTPDTRETQKKGTKAKERPSRRGLTGPRR